MQLLGLHWDSVTSQGQFPLKPYKLQVEAGGSLPG